MAQLSAQRCEACNAETPALSAAEIESLRRELDDGWTVVDGRLLRRRIKFSDFRSAFAMASAVAGIAEEEGHHPDLCVGWARLDIDLTTHAIHGLSRNDFILAAKIDSLPR